jgi:demethylmenaquinone methyltransferase / 2-methoxy-6-polyprenyl-1,4-benzoquinol methylase
MVVIEQREGYSLAKKFFNYDNASSYDKLVKFATLGQDFYWKKKISDKVLEKGLILDLACGTGILSSLMNKKGFDTHGVDLTFDYLKLSKTKSSEYFCINGFAEFLPFKGNHFDFIISSYLPKYSDLILLVDECYRVLKGGGIVVLHDFIYPMSPVLQELWKIYFKILKLGGGKVFKNWDKVFKELELLIMKSDWYYTLPNLLINKGFINVISETLTFETSAIISAKKP